MNDHPNRSYWTSPGTWTDPDCIECGGDGAPCCEEPDHPYRSASDEVAAPTEPGNTA